MKIRQIVHLSGIFLLILAAVSLYIAAKNFFSIYPADCYEDYGVHTFVPYAIRPVQVENNTTGRYQRNHPTRTIYKVYYQTTDGSKYQWSVEGGAVQELAESLYNQGTVERRVLFIPSDNTYITVEADQTAENHTLGLQRKYFVLLGLSGTYVLIYLTVWIFIIRGQKKKETRN